MRCAALPNHSQDLEGPRPWGGNPLRPGRTIEAMHQCGCGDQRIPFGARVRHMQPRTSLRNRGIHRQGRPGERRQHALVDPRLQHGPRVPSRLLHQRAGLDFEIVIAEKDRSDG